jgi:DNA-binding winged helix-turn-helix (wHTH) protein
MSMPMMSSSVLSTRTQEGIALKPQGRYLCFSQFQVDLQREELFKDGSRVHIPAKVYQVLLALIEKPGEIVTRENLRARLWPCGTFVNYDANVNTTVNKLRLALGDSPEKPVYVETIPRQGYCFLGKVERKSEVAKSSRANALAASETEAPIKLQMVSDAPALKRIVSGRFPSFFASGWAAAVLLCGVLIGIGIVLFMHRPL